MEYVRAAPPTTSVFPGRVLWATLHAIDDDDLGVAQRAENAGAVGRMGMSQFGLVVRGDRGRRPGPHRRPPRARPRSWPRSARALRRLRHSYAPMHVQELLIARAALRDGWGDPVTWLREAEAFFAAGGYDRAARRCRTMLGAAGAPMPRRGRGDSDVPTALRALGVTSREVDVLKLVAAGLSNREIGEPAVPRDEDRRAARRQPAGAHRRRRPGRARRAGAGARRANWVTRRANRGCRPRCARGSPPPRSTPCRPPSTRSPTASTASPPACPRSPPAASPSTSTSLDGDEPLLFHTGPRRMFPLVAEAVGEGAPARPAALGQLRPRRGRRVRRDEPVAGRRAVGRGRSSTRWAARCRWTTSPTARRCPSPTTAARDLGGHRIRTIVTPHVPHGWEAQVIYDETTGTLLCGDLFTRTGDGAALVHDADLVEPALAADDMFGATCLTPSTAPALRASGRPGAPYAGAHARPGVRGRRRGRAARPRRRLRGAVHAAAVPA